MNMIMRLLFVLTGLSPVCIAYASLYVRTNLELAIVLGVTSIGLVLICALIVFIVRRVASSEPIKITSVRASDENVLAFIIAYLLPLLTQDGFVINIETSIVVIALLGLVLMTSNSYHYNPLLVLFFGYHYYEVETENGVTYVIMTRKTIVSTNNIHQCVRISPYLFLEK